MTYRVIRVRVYVPVLVLTVTTRTSLSLPACVLMTFAIGHRVGTIPFSRRTTMSPTTMFLEGRRHLWNFCRLTRYSEDYHCQKCLTRDWHRSHCCRSEKERNETAGFGRAWPSHMQCLIKLLKRHILMLLAICTPMHDYKALNQTNIMELVETICRDSADTQYMLIQISQNLQNSWLISRYNILLFIFKCFHHEQHTQWR